MRLSRRSALGVIALAAVPGCTWFGGDEDEEIPEPEAPEGLAARGREPVERIERVELGRTATGLALTAFGLAPGLGYARPRLVPRREGRPSQDGYLEFDMLAIPPDPDRDLPRGEPSARRLRADILLSNDELEGLRGLRVFALEGGQQLSF